MSLKKGPGGREVNAVQRVARASPFHGTTAPRPAMHHVHRGRVARGRPLSRCCTVSQVVAMAAEAGGRKAIPKFRIEGRAHPVQVRSLCTALPPRDPWLRARVRGRVCVLVCGCGAVQWV